MARRIQNLAGRPDDDTFLFQPVRTLAEIAAVLERRGERITHQGISFMLRQAERKIRLALMADDEVMELVDNLSNASDRRRARSWR